MEIARVHTYSQNTVENYYFLDTAYNKIRTKVIWQNAESLIDVPPGES